MTETTEKPSVNPSSEDRLTGPSGGAWFRTDAGEHGGRLFCGLCQTGGHHRGWQYYVGLVSHVSICDDCADSAVGKE